MATVAHSLKVVLFEPEIPHNTGAIGRSCLACAAQLHLVRPYGFRLSDEQLRRSGLDYWQHVDLTEHESLDGFLAALPQDAKLIPFTTKAGNSLFGARMPADAWLMFGPESRGLPDDLLQRHAANAVRIPMHDEHVRSLNLANAVSVALYEAWRQNA